MKKEIMNNYYITFGQKHVHSWAGKTLDKDIVIKIKTKNHDKAVERTRRLFGKDFSMLYKEKPDMSYFPRGIITL